jgi:hypothetical protein
MRRGVLHSRIPAGLLVAVLLLAAAGAGEAAVPPASSEPRAQTAGPQLRISNGPKREIAPAVAWNSTDTEYLVVWEDWRDYGGAARGIDIYGRLIDANGAPSGSAFRISGPADVYDDQAPAVAWDEDRNEYLVVWRRWADAYAFDEIYGQRIQGGGGFAGPSFRISGPAAIGRDVSNPALAYNPVHGQYLVVYELYWELDDVICGQRVGGNGTLFGSEFRIGGNLAVDTDSPQVVFNATRQEYLVVWDDNRNGQNRGWDVYARRVDADGTRLDKDLRISGAGAVENDWAPVVAWNSAQDEYLVLWNDERNWEWRSTDIYGVRLDGSNGARLSGDVRYSSNTAILDDMVVSLGYSATSGRYLMVFNDDWSDLDLGREVYGRRIRSTGAVQGAPFRIVGPKGSPALDDSDDLGGVLAWNGTDNQFLVVWMDARLVVPPGYNLDLWGRRVLG